MVVTNFGDGRDQVTNYKFNEFYIVDYTSLACCVSPDLQTSCQIQQLHPSNHTLQLIISIYPLNLALPCFLYSNTRPCGTIGIAIPLQLPEPMILRMFNETYFKSTTDGIYLFRGNWKYIYSVLVEVLLTYQGKIILH